MGYTRRLNVLYSFQERLPMYQSPGRHQARSNRQPQFGEFQKRNNAPRHQPPAIDPTQLASAIQVRNFKALLDAATSVENLALALDMPLQRVNELLRGENFPHDVAYHIEVTLELPSGFLDRVNARLTPEVVNRLKSPLNFNATENEAESTETQTAVAVQAPVQLTLAAVPEAAPASTEAAPQRQDEDMAKKQSSQPAKKTRAPAATAPTTHTPGEDILDTRRINLAVLTEAPGAKSKLCEIMGMSPANISHRIHRNKKLDDAEVKRFTTALHLPKDWFDGPRTAKDIPPAVVKMLDPGPKQPRGTKKALREAAQGLIPGKPAARKGPTTRVLAPADVKMPRLSTGVVAPTRAPAPVSVPALASVGASAPVSTPSAADFAPAPATVRAPASAEQRRFAAAPAASAIPEDVGTIGPIATALVQTLALKAREGRLDEATALKMLTQAAAL
ncbi:MULTISPECIES: hypothetical protein [unclassified Variovorax]|uniref:hypothetical protein n=1 Tax=unclassified Variovorax TaxID=663243 RepID=UPI0011AF0E10|nr:MULTISPECIES: hypothetical protein [unclassified Variovorax]